MIVSNSGWFLLTMRNSASWSNQTFTLPFANVFVFILSWILTCYAIISLFHLHYWRDQLNRVIAIINKTPANFTLTFIIIRVLFKVINSGESDLRVKQKPPTFIRGPCSMSGCFWFHPECHSNLHIWVISIRRCFRFLIMI